MSSSPSPSLLSLVLWPAVITTLVSVARVWAEVSGRLDAASGGGGAWLGITWLIFVFGAWFGWRLARGGDAPRLRPAALWYVAGLAAVIGTFAFLAKDADLNDTSEAGQQALRSIAQTIAVVALAAAAASLLIWTRLGLALFVYGLCARLVVLGITWLAKVRGWDTHYTKLGPAGFETDLARTLEATSVAQLGFWVPFTVLAGGLCGSLASLLARRK